MFVIGHPSGDHSEFSGFVRRILRAYSRRCACADPDDLAELLALQGEVDAAIALAVAGLRRSGFSWAEIAVSTGTTRQAAQQRWGVKAALTTVPSLTAYRQEPTDLSVGVAR